jgi:AcrR family transcriptional regulator
MEVMEEVVEQEALVRTGLRERKKAQTYDAIMGAALDLFERNGYDATTVEEIADAANVSPRTFFRYFDAKVDVVMHNKEHDDLGLDDYLALRPASEGPVEAMRHVFREVIGPIFLGDEVTNRQIRLMLSTPSLRAMAREHFNEHEDELAEVFAKRLCVDASALRPHVIAAAVGTTLWTAVNRWVATEGDTGDLIEMIDEGLAMLGDGLDRG